jgi:hypothetical protein
MNDELGSQLARYSKFREYVQHEDNLINNRMTWMLAIQGFLYAAYGFSVQKKLEVAAFMRAEDRLYVEDSSFGSREVPLTLQDLADTMVELQVFVVSMALVGIVISACVLLSIHAAIRASDHVDALFRREFGQAAGQGYVELRGGTEMVRFPGLTGGGQERNVVLGFIAAHGIPVAVIASWLAAIYYALR